MAARDRWERVITCPKCGEAGVIGLSQDDHPFMRNWDTEIDYVKGEFTAKKKSGREIAITCKKCSNESWIGTVQIRYGKKCLVD